MSGDPKRETLSSLRAARAAHRVASDVGVAKVDHLLAVRCRGCGQRFSIDPAAARADTRVDRARVLCTGCRDREAPKPARGDAPPCGPLGETLYADCARCGYLLRGLTRDDRCPECGLRVAASLGARPEPIPRPPGYSTIPNNCYQTDAETYVRQGMPEGPPVLIPRRGESLSDEPFARSESLLSGILRRVKLWFDDVNDRRRGAGRF